MKANICVQCNKTLASPQSLWNHRQRCKTNATKNLSLSNEQTKKSESTLAHKEKLHADIVNNVRAKDQCTISVLPMKLMNPEPDASIDFKSKETSESELDSDSDQEETEIFKADEPDTLEELKAAFRNLYKKVDSNMEKYKNLVLILDKLRHVNFLTEEECKSMNSLLKKKIVIV